MIDVDYGAQDQNQQGQPLEVTGEKNGECQRNVQRERDEHPHPVTMQNLPAFAGVKIRLYGNVEKPILATEQRLASPAKATVDADHPEENVDDYDALVDLHLFAPLSHHF
jgi:hypothetical protein